MKQIKKSLKLVVVLVFGLVLFSGCDQNPIPEKGAKVSSSSTDFKSLARSMNLDCQRINCCTMDGIETSCALVYACVEAGFCQVLAQE